MISAAHAPTRSAISRHPPATEFPAPPLTGGARVEVCIVGAGLAGLIAAYLLAREHRSVMVIDEGPLGGGYAGSESGQLGTLELPYAQLESLHGPIGARIVAQSLTAAIDTIEAIVRRERIACEFERLDGYRLCSAEAAGTLQREAEAARRAGVEGMEVAYDTPISGRASGPCLRHPGQAQFHPHKFVAGLARAIARVGGRIHCGVRTRSLQPGQPLLTWAGHRIEAGGFVMPVGGTSEGRLDYDGVPGTRAANAVALRVPRGAVTRALYWDSEHPGRCARLRAAGSTAGETLLAAGEEPFEVIEAWARANFPVAGDAVQHLRSEVPRAPELFAFVGGGAAGAQSVCTSTARRGSAMSRAAIAGMVVRDFFLGEKLVSDTNYSCFVD